MTTLSVPEGISAATRSKCLRVAMRVISEGRDEISPKYSFTTSFIVEMKASWTDSWTST